jgi:hypothetical protein
MRCYCGEAANVPTRVKLPPLLQHRHLNRPEQPFRLMLSPVLKFVGSLPLVWEYLSIDFMKIQFKYKKNV